MRPTTVFASLGILALSLGLTGCASDRGFHCGGDLVPINVPAKAGALAPLVPKPVQPGTSRRNPRGAP